MRPPHVRFTMRRMMAVIAITGFVLGGTVGSWRLKCLQDSYRHLAEKYANAVSLLGHMQRSAVQTLDVTEGFLRHERELAKQQRGPFPAKGIRMSEECERLIKEGEEGVDQIRAYLSLLTRQAEYYSQLRIKYGRAAVRPWLPVEPDGSPPPLPHPPESPIQLNEKGPGRPSE